MDHRRAVTKGLKGHFHAVTKRVFAQGHIFMQFKKSGLKQCLASIAGLAGLVGLTLGSSAATAGVPIIVEFVTDEIPTPMDVVAPRDDFSRLFVLDRGGQVRIIKDGVVLVNPYIDVSDGISTLSERGLLGLAFHPNYAENGWAFVRYNDASGATVVKRFTVSGNPDVADDASERTILRIDNAASNHNGGSIAFSPTGDDDYLYITVGDDANSGNAQDISRQLHGKILRVDVSGDDFPSDDERNYAIPPSNPYVNRHGEDEIWASGLRNPFRMSFDRVTGDLWTADVGGTGYEEVNIQPAETAELNYGWPCMEGNHCGPGDGCNCFSSTLADPVFEYDHNDGCAITGGRVYRGCAIPSLRGTYFCADFCSGIIWSFTRGTRGAADVQERQDELEANGDSLENIVAFGEDARGELYICSLGGSIFKIIPVNPPPDNNGNGIADPCEAAIGDINGDSIVNLADVLEVINGLGPCGGCAADLDLNGVIDFADLQIVVNHWG